MNINLFRIYRQLPEGLKCFLSRKYYRPILGKNVKLFGKIQFEENVKIGNYTYIHGPAYLARIHIGKFCSIAKNLSCITSNHNYKQFSTYPFAGDITKIPELLCNSNAATFIPILPYAGCETTIIGNDVWIGEGVSILRGVTIGDGAVVGANSFITKDIPPYSVVAGVPAKHIRYRFDEEMIKRLIETEWWNWPINTIADKFDYLCNIVK